MKLSINCNDSSKRRYSSGNDLSFRYSNTSDLSCDCSNRSESSYDNWLQVVASHVAMSKVSWTKARIRDNLRCEDSFYDDSLSRDLWNSAYSCRCDSNDRDASVQVVISLYGRDVLSYYDSNFRESNCNYSTQVVTFQVVTFCPFKSWRFKSWRLRSLWVLTKEVAANY